MQYRMELTHEFGNSRVSLLDCMEGMKQYPDNHFELAVVDPPYGIGFGKFNRTNKDSLGVRYKANKYKNTDWDANIPEEEYFTELKRVSKNQIIWGGNYFNLPPTQCIFFWYKNNPVPNFSDGELAWTSFKKPSACFAYKYYGNIEGNTSASKKYHPTQKPVALYDWIFKNYAKEGDKILDTHLGSQSSRISAYKNGLDFTGFELDEDYFRDGNKRFTDFTNQLVLL